MIRITDLGCAGPADAWSDADAHIHRPAAPPTLVVTDEGQIITDNPPLARCVAKIIKMWRKLGARFWIATRILEDFP